MKCKKHPDVEIIPVMGFAPAGVCFACVAEMRRELDKQDGVNDKW